MLQDLQVRHFEYETTRSFEDVISAFERAVGTVEGIGWESMRNASKSVGELACSTFFTKPPPFRVVFASLRSSPSQCGEQGSAASTAVVNAFPTMAATSKEGSWQQQSQ